jgi:hypothetical protein
MSSLWDRQFGPVSGAATVANQSALNVAAALSGPLAALQLVTVTTETLILNPENLAVALSCVLHPNSQLEQTLFNVIASGYIKTTSTSNITLTLYSGTAIVAGNLLKASAATAQNTATAAFSVKGELIFDSVSGTLAGEVGFYINKVKIASATLANFPTGFNNTGNAAAVPPTLPVLPAFCLTITSSGAAANTPTTINVQKFTCG